MIAELPDRCFSLPRVRMPQACLYPYCGAREYERVLRDDGLFRWRALAWLGKPRRSIMAAKRDGEESGLPLVEEARHGVLAMTFRDLLPAYAEAKLRLGFLVAVEGWRVSPSSSRVVAVVVIDREVVARCGPFGFKQVPNRLAEIRALLEKPTWKETTYVSHGLRDGWTGRMKKQDLVDYRKRQGIPNGQPARP